MVAINGTPTTDDGEQYDVIVVGGGTAGCVLANRISEDPNLSVLLIEAGEDRNSDPRITTPGLFPRLFGDPNFDWQFASLPQANLNGRVVQHPRGKVLGGSSAINLQALAYPSKATADVMSELGVRGWDWEDIVPYYRKFQTTSSPKTSTQHHQHLDPALGGISGPIQSSFPAQLDPLHAAWIETLNALGYKSTGDPLSGESLGAYAIPCSVTPETRERSHSGKDYYEKAANRSNLHLLTKTCVGRVVLDRNATGEVVAAGVAVSQMGHERLLKARQEVVLAAGAIGSPQLLELSGIGSPDLLASHGIEVIIDNPGVENLQDHQLTGLCYEVSDGVETRDQLRRDPSYAQKAFLEYQTRRTGPLAASPAEALAYLPMDCFSGAAGQEKLKELLDEHLSTKAISDLPPGVAVQYKVLRKLLETPTEASAVSSPISLGIYPESDSISSGDPIAQNNGSYLTQFLMLSHPFSRGSTHISSADPQVHPVIDPAYGSHPLDIELYARHLHFLEKIASTAPLTGYLKPNGRRLPVGNDATTIERAKDLSKSYSINSQQIPDRTSLINYELEQLLVDTGGINDRTFKSAITPCSNYADHGGPVNDNTKGLQTSAQWIRVAFHDFNTANVHSGEGGMDASIGFETLRPTNAGPAFNDSLFFFQSFVSDMVSMADLIALGAVMGIGSCGGPYVPLRGGRIDATEAGPLAHCDPDTPLPGIFHTFHMTGMSNKEAIELTACGHTMGGVHKNVFPQIGTDAEHQVTESVDLTNNSDGRVTFDDSVDVFDPHTIQEYLAWRGKKGGPMVTTSNKINRNDLRLYTSDRNSTVKELARSKEAFSSACSRVIYKMLNTVPRGVELTPDIEPYQVKPINITLNIDWKGDMEIGGYIRYLNKAGTKPAPADLLIAVVGRNGRMARSSTRAHSDTVMGAGTSIFGPTHFYPFTIRFSSDIGLSGLQVLGQKLPMQDSMFVVPKLSSVTPPLAEVNADMTTGFAINITVAFLTKRAPAFLSADFVVPKRQDGTLSPRIDHTLTKSLPLIGRAGPFVLYSSVTTEHNITSSAELIRSSINVDASHSNSKVMFFQPWSLFNTGHGANSRAVRSLSALP